MQSAEPSTTAPARALPSRAGVSFRLVTCVLTFFLVAYAVCTFFSLHTFEKLYVPLAVERYVVASAQLRDDLQTYLCGSDTIEELRKCKALRARGRADSLGPRITRFEDKIVSIERQYVDDGAAAGSASSRVSISIAPAANGTIYFGSRNESVGQKLPDLSQYEKIADAVTYDEEGGRYLISLPLYDVEETKLAVVSISLDESLVASVTEMMLQQHLRPLLMILAVCVVALLIVTLVSVPKNPAVDTLPRKRITGGTLLLLCLSQVAASWMSMDLLKKNERVITAQKAEELALQVKQDVERHLAYGADLEQVADRMSSPDISGVASSDVGAGTPVYSLQSLDGVELARLVHAHHDYRALIGNGAGTPVTAKDRDALVVLIESNGKPIGRIITEIEQKSLGKQLFTVMVDVLIAVVISILCLVELLILSFKYIETLFKRAPRDEDESSGGANSVHYSMMRPAIFLFLFGVDFSAVLIPLQMENLYEPMLGLPKDFIIALPITAMFFCVGITFLIAGAWMDRRGWNEPFISGVVITGLFKLYAWLAPSAAHFIVAMGGVGFGYGLALMAAQGFVMANTTERDKAHGIAYFFAGVYAGNIGGLAVGAMVAERIDYEYIFLIGSLFVFASLAFSWKFLRPAFQSPDSIDPSQSGAEFKASNFWRFAVDRNVLSLVLFCSIPAAVAMIGFLHYFSPIYLNRLGVSESLIGGVLILYGISLVYLSPLVSRLIDATERKDLFIALGCALGAIGFMSFAVLEGLAAVLTAVLFLGLSGSCLQSSQTAYTLKLRATRELGTGKGVAFVRATSRVGQMLGPIVFSWFVMASDTEISVANFGLVYFAIALTFILFSKQEGREERELRTTAEAVPAAGANSG